MLVTMGGRSDDLSALSPMLELAEGGVAIVAASGYVTGGRERGGPLWKRTLSRLAGLLLHLIGGLPIHDPTSAFKLYSGPDYGRALMELHLVLRPGGLLCSIEPRRSITHRLMDARTFGTPLPRIVRARCFCAGRS